jgi:hypothetical protein
MMSEALALPLAQPGPMAKIERMTRPRDVPGKHKALAIPRDWPRTDVAPSDLAQRVHYVGSGEHKTAPFGSVKPEPRSDGSFCDPKYQGQEARIDAALRLAVQHGCVSAKFDPQLGFPRYIWGWLDGYFTLLG